MGLARVLEHTRQELLLAGSRPRRTRTTGPTALTEAQREVAALAAEGLTNREIAERLFVTIKTVETHLMAVYRKLGIRSRDELGVGARGPPAPSSTGAAAGVLTRPRAGAPTLWSTRARAATRRPRPQAVTEGERRCQSPTSTPHGDEEVFERQRRGTALEWVTTR